MDESGNCSKESENVQSLEVEQKNISKSSSESDSTINPNDQLNEIHTKEIVYLKSCKTSLGKWHIFIYWNGRLVEKV